MKPEESIGYIKFNKILAYILAVLFLSAACGLAAVSGSHSLTKTYNSGEICDISNGIMSIDIDPLSEDNYFWVSTLEDAFQWNYMYIDISDADFQSADFQIQGYNEGTPAGDAEKYRISTGYNEIKLSGAAFDTVKIEVIGEEPVTFSTKFIQFRENKFFFSLSRYLGFVGIFASVFIFISGLIILFIRKRNLKIDWYGPIDFLQDIYLSLGNRFLKISLKVPYKVKHILRITALIVWMFWIMFIYNIGKYMLTAYFKYNVLIFCVIMFLIAVSLIEKPLEKKDWNKPLVHAWLWLSILMCISEFFIIKRFCMIGYVNLTVFGFYYFVWNNLEDRERIVNEIITSFKIAFLISLCFTLTCRPRDEMGGLIGHTWNPNIYGIFCAIVLMAFLASIKKNFIYRKNKIHLIFNIMGAIISLSFVLLAGSRAGMVIAVPGMMFFLIEYISFVRKGLVGKVKGIAGLFVFAGVFYAVHVFLSWATVNLPLVQVVFSWDSSIPNESLKSVISVGMETPAFQNIMYNENARAFLTGRNLYWAEYLRSINFLGHEYYPVMWGGARYPHNGILGIIYRYGILTAVPYIIMFLNVCTESFKMYFNERKKGSSSFYIWICALGISFCMLVENFERPFLATEWLWWYWMLGFLFVKEKRDKLKGDTEEYL
ncbi:MAG: O-antigen ligase family protein [Anaerovoracaceae bacterium]